MHREPAEVDLLRAVRHELRTSINHVIGYSELLVDQVSDPELTRDLWRIESAGKQLLELVNTSLDSSTFSTDFQQLQRLGHAFRTPLNAILGYAELLREAPRELLPATFGDDLHRISAAGEKLLGLVSALLDVAGAERSAVEARTRWAQSADAPLQDESPVTATGGARPVTGGRLLVVDDDDANRDLLSRRLNLLGYSVVQAENGVQALELASSGGVDLVLLDLFMPGLDGYEVCTRLRNNPATSVLPVVMLTASGEEEKVKALEAGVDDFIPKPYNQSELVARVRSLLRVKAYHDVVQRQAQELAEWNRTLEAKVRAQVDELERIGRLRRYLSPQVAEVIISSGDESLLQSHRREICVVFCDLRGFTAFAEATEPDELMAVLREYHTLLGDLIDRFEGTLERFAGDGIMVFFNDPIPIEDPALRAVSMAIDMRDSMASMAANWRIRGHDLGFGLGIALGEATLGRIGFDRRFDYAAIGRVTNLAARLCAAASSGQILVSQAVHAATADRVLAEPVADLNLKGFAQPVAAFNVQALSPAPVVT
jgi:adenylate cyclase